MVTGVAAGGSVTPTSTVVGQSRGNVQGTDAQRFAQGSGAPSSVTSPHQSSGTASDASALPTTSPSTVGQPSSGARPSGATGASTGSGWSPVTRPPFQLEATSPRYYPITDEMEARARAAIPRPARPLPASQAADGPAPAGNGGLAKATPFDAPLTGIPRLIEELTKPIGAISNVAGGVLNFLGLQKPLAQTLVTLIDNPITDAVIRTGAGIGGLAYGVAGQLIGSDAVSDMTRSALNFISSERGGAALASPALQSMTHEGGAGWQGVLDGLVTGNAGRDLYSTFFLGNLKNRTGGGQGPEFYKQLVVDTWDQAPAGREFLGSVGRSAVSREDAAKWYSDYYYDILNEESGNGIATKVSDTLDYRFGLDANNMNTLFKNGAQSAAAFGRAFPTIAAELAGHGSTGQTSSTGSAASPQAGTSHSSTQASGSATPSEAQTGNNPYTGTNSLLAPATRGGLSSSNSALPTVSELSGASSSTRAYRNNPASTGILGALTEGIAGSVVSLLSGPVMSIGGGLLGKEGMGNLSSTLFSKILSGNGIGDVASSFVNGAAAIPGGSNAVGGFLRGALSSSAGTAWAITAMQQFSRSEDGLEMFKRAFQPLLAKQANGLSMFDELLEQAKTDPVIANNLRAMADELSESPSAMNMMKVTGYDQFIKDVKKAIPIASRYAYLETGPNAHLPLSDPRRLAELLRNNMAGEQVMFDKDGKMSDFAKVGLRMFGHDILDGRLDGDVVLRTLLNPSGSDNADFRRNVEFVKKWGEMDLQDDGKINGSVYRNLVEQCWKSTGGTTPSPLSQVPLSSAVADDGEWRRDIPNAFDFKEVKVNKDTYNKLAANYKLTPLELTDVVLWGHYMANLPSDPAARSAAFDGQLRKALNGERSATFENIFVRDVPGVRQHFEQLIGNFDKFNANVMQSLGKLAASQAQTSPQSQRQAPMPAQFQTAAPAQAAALGHFHS